MAKSLVSGLTFTHAFGAVTEGLRESVVFEGSRTGGILYWVGGHLVLKSIDNNEISSVLVSAIQQLGLA